MSGIGRQDYGIRLNREGQDSSYDGITGFESVTGMGYEGESVPDFG